MKKQLVLSYLLFFIVIMKHTYIIECMYQMTYSTLLK